MQTQSSNLVFLPGWSFSASIFKMMSPHLRQHQLHFADLPPLQNTDAHAISEFARTLPARSTLIGWSLGGLVAIALCAQASGQFQKLILLGSSPKFVAEESWPGINSEIAEQFLTRLHRDSRKLMTDFHKLVRMPSRSIHTHLKEHALKNQEHMPSQLNYLLASDFRKELSELGLPTLSIAGEQDAILPPSDSNHVIIPNAGHAFPFTHCAEVCQHILEFENTNHE